MPRRTAPFRQSEVKQFVKAVSAGMDVDRVELDPATGRIVAFRAHGRSEPSPATAFDEWKAKKDADKA